jgi:hypothetical protein
MFNYFPIHIHKHKNMGQYKLMEWPYAITWGNHCVEPIKSGQFLYWPCWKALNQVLCTFVVSLIFIFLANGAI